MLGSLWFSSFSAGGAPAGGTDYELISTTILGSNTASVTFDVTGLGGTYKHLQIRALGKSPVVASDAIDLTFNNDSGNNYSYHSLYANGSSIGSEASTSRANIAAVCGMKSSSDTSVFEPSIIDLLDVFSASKNKTVRSLRGATGASGSGVFISSGAWFSTSTVTSIKLTGRSNSIATGSRFSLYGLK